MKFRPCIDLHDGKVKQIVGSTLSDQKDQAPVTNFEADKPSEWFAELYRNDNLEGGHIIRLGPNNDEAARSALKAWPGGMQIGGGINDQNALEWLQAGASSVIVTSFIFSEGQVHRERLEKLEKLVGRERLVLDLSCRKRDGKYWIVTDRWQKFTNVNLSEESLEDLSRFCSEFLIHAVDVEGKCSGIEHELVAFLGEWAQIPITYAGGIHSMEDIQSIERSGHGKIDFTVGSALDIFGGKQLRYEEIKLFK